MLIPPRFQSGVSLIEMLVALGIVATMVGMGAPSYLTWMRNSQIRAATENIQSGLQLARSEALKRNARVRFQLTSSTGNDCALSTTSVNWVVSRDDATGACGGTPSETVAPRIIQVYSAAATGQVATVAAGQSEVVFNGLGRVVPTPGGNITINVSNPSGGNCIAASGKMRCLRIVVSPTGQISQCDPSLSSSDPQACP